MLDEKISLICKNINRYGLYRYDPRDIDDFTNKINNKHIRRMMSICLQLVEIINPIMVRKLILSSKRIYPTTYVFLAESMFATGNSLEIKWNDKELINMCIDMYYKSEGYWKFKENKYFYPVESTKEPSMPLYMLCRCNNLLARMGTFYNNQNFSNISYQSMKYVFENHIINYYDNGSESVSYYYNSADCTINVNSELVEWMFRLDIGNTAYLQHAKGILKMILFEQNENGSWYYFSKNHISKYNLVPIIDCHHTATVLYNLIHIYELTENLDIECRCHLEKSIHMGIKYFVENFYDEKGNGITIIGKKRRASSVQYAESLIAIIEYLRVFRRNITLERSVFLSNLSMNISCKLEGLIKKNGSAPGDSKIVAINLNNINWGNGAVLLALTLYRNYCRTIKID